MPVLHFYSVGLLRMAYETARRSEISAAAATDQLTDDTLVAVILATSAAEAFIKRSGGLHRSRSVDVKRWVATRGNWRGDRIDGKGSRIGATEISGGGRPPPGARRFGEMPLRFSPSAIS
jgi:hypothetical protein